MKLIWIHDIYNVVIGWLYALGMPILMGLLVNRGTNSPDLGVAVFLFCVVMFPKHELKLYWSEESK